MKIIITFILTFYSIFLFSDELISTEGFDTYGEKTYIPYAYKIIETYINSDKKVYIKVYINRILRHKIHYKTIDRKIKHGKYYHYSEDESVLWEGRYENDEMVGDWYVYDSDYNLIETLNYDVPTNKSCLLYTSPSPRDA